MIEINEQLIDTIADALAECGYIVADDALPDFLLDSLINHFANIQQDEFKNAGVGRSDQYQLLETVRSDKIHWIENNTETTTQFLQWMDTVRVGINRRLFLGLFDYESHFAEYPVNAFYKKHVDTFKETRSQGKPVRLLSTVLYLNRGWQSHNGGELVLYAEDSDSVLERVSPLAGRLVIFLSEKFPHEVLPATAQRKSIAGWFRVNA